MLNAGMMSKMIKLYENPRYLNGLTNTETFLFVLNFNLCLGTLHSSYFGCFNKMILGVSMEKGGKIFFNISVMSSHLETQKLFIQTYLIILRLQ